MTAKKKVFSFVNVARDCRTFDESERYPKLEKIGVWTDGVGISHEREPGWPSAYRFKEGRRYRITIEEVEE